MANHIFVIEDEQDIARLIRLYLEKEGFRVSHFADGSRGVEAVLNHPPDLLILDLMLPGTDGLEICKKIRSAPETRQLPVLILSAKGEELDRVLGLELGADDYLTKPFSPREMVARTKALLRRNRPPETAQSLSYGPLFLDPVRHEVLIKGKETVLTAKEFGLLEILLKNRGRVLSRDTLLNQVWGYDYFGTTRTVDVHVGRIREKIPLLSEAILTVKSVGYKIKDDE